MALTYPQPPLENCQFQILTAPGPGAVAVIEVTSVDAHATVHLQRRITSSSTQDSAQSDLQLIPVGRIQYGQWNGEDLVIVRTAESTLEIQCHGGAVAIDRICTDLKNDGAVEKALGNGALRNDGEGLSIQQQIQHTIETRLPFARSRKAAGLILSQATNSLVDDLTIVNSVECRPIEAADIRQRLEMWQNAADHLTEPWRVVLAGAPNVGKSSLINVIAGMERSIVYDQPGTTRDIVEFDTLIDGWSFRFVDTAGIRPSDAAGQIEALGIEQTFLATSNCDVLCLVIDGRIESLAAIELLAIESLPKHTVVVRNKCDLSSQAAESGRGINLKTSAFGHLPQMNVSANSGAGINELLHWIKLAMVPEEPTAETAIPILPFG